MTTNNKETLARRLFEEVWNKNNAVAANEIISDQYNSMENQIFNGANGHDVFTADQKLYNGLYKDLSFTVKDLFSHGDTVVVTWDASGISPNNFFTSRVGKKTNKSLRAEGVSLVKFKNDKIVEARLYWPQDPLFP